MKETLEQYDDGGLRAIIAQAQEILDARDRERKAETARRIRALASEAGLSVEVKRQKKRGRPKNAGKRGNGKSDESASP
ncbi:MAG TPA: hypothetical protein VKA19_08965 [Alphaproteobacteria bacterium]|nr:hypothetical protein [Alphaproteobacteria bacterium]